MEPDCVVRSMTINAEQSRPVCILELVGLIASGRLAIGWILESAISQRRLIDKLTSCQSLAQGY